MLPSHLRILAAAAGLVLLAGACGRHGAPTPAPQGIRLAPLADAGTAEAEVLPGALPTWTLGPPGQPVGTPVPGAHVPGAGPESVQGVIPAPTARATVAVGQAGPPATDPEIVALMGRVSAGRLAADVASLARFGTRNTLSPTDGQNRGIGAARDWLMVQLSAIGRASASQLQTEWEDFPLSVGGQATTQRNLFATLTGIGDPKRFVYLTAHYDSRAENANDGQAAAPGADDNASGVAALLELARVLGGRQWDATIRLVAFAAEEQGLKGSRYHAPRAQEVGLPIVAVLNNDIVGATRAADGTVIADRARVFSAPPDDGPSRRLARYAQVVAQRYGLLALDVVPQTDRPGRGGDHEAFSEAGFAAVRLIEAADDQARQHNAQDGPERIDPEYLAAMTRLNVALVGNLALAPPAPEAAPTLAPLAGGGRQVTWAPVTAGNVAGYYVAWRPANEQAYRAVLWAGPGPTFDLTGVPAGRLAVAVAAADDRGHLSPFSPEATK
jgi:hypothetical protein